MSVGSLRTNYRSGKDEAALETCQPEESVLRQVNAKPMSKFDLFIFRGEMQKITNSSTVPFKCLYGTLTVPLPGE